METYKPQGPKYWFFDTSFTFDEILKCKDRSISNITLFLWTFFGIVYGNEEKLDILGYIARELVKKEKEKQNLKDLIQKL